ncbi:methyl-accepting chemotaxis protein [Geobacter pickeringii]|uniref:Chemotaxis protein n=1 Tax=Geobacter pickeringii TaxID=345632 RepID=A0A0B5BFL1_9BACT|nr:methyl-accepting chemotaxis protein [Geobacter pickeringii]AJE03320.1 chemotaxis protein [Geobacter pickeringii]
METGAIIKNRSSLYGILGCAMGIGAPVAWTVIRLIFFSDPDQPFLSQIFGDVFKNGYNLALYSYMGIGTATVLAVVGYYIGKTNDELHARAVELDGLHQEVASQKEVFENRYRVLDSNIKNFHQISSKIQRSIDVDEVLRLCADGLHDVLGYERVNILMADEARTSLSFVASIGTAGFNPSGVTLPLDLRSGVIFKCFNDRQLFMIDDIGVYPSDFKLQPPYDAIKALRSSSFVVCPIVVKGEAIGLFGIDNCLSKRSLNDTDVDTIKLFADQAASAIVRINLLKAIGALTSELETTFADLLKNRDHYSRYVINLQDAVNSVADGTAHIASGAESVLTSVDETSSAVSNIYVSIEQVSRNLDYLSESIDKSASAMEELNSTIKNVEQSAAISHEVSSKVKSEADRGRTVVDETIRALAEIQNSVELSFEGMKRLTENSGRIESIVGVINDITKRTNLLALNASIIAAQAGEYGKSFGVVADEIRNLSLQTGQSTGEITNIIEEIMNESRHAAENISASKDRVRRGVELGGVMGQSLEVIHGSSVRSMDMTREIKTATEEQARSVQLVTHSIENVSSMSSQIFKASKEQSDAAMSIVRSIDAIKEMTQEMVKATVKQVEDGSEIKKSVEAVGQMVTRIFEDMEVRREESSEVVKELEMMKKIAG